MPAVFTLPQVPKSAHLAAIVFTAIACDRANELAMDNRLIRGFVYAFHLLESQQIRLTRCNGESGRSQSRFILTVGLLFLLLSQYIILVHFVRFILSHLLIAFLRFVR